VPENAGVKDIMRWSPDCVYTMWIFPLAVIATCVGVRSTLGTLKMAKLARLGKADCAGADMVSVVILMHTASLLLVAVSFLYAMFPTTAPDWSVRKLSVA
jgi:hypothetical protein